MAFDVYLAILDNVECLVLGAIQRDLPDWQIKNTCPCCTYELRDEEELVFHLLFAMDGNNSLKHVLRREFDTGEEPAALLEPLGWE